MSTNSNKYNGWSNYETWLCKLWMDNDGNEYWDEQAQEIFEAAEADKNFTKSERACLTLADVLKEQHEEMIEEQFKGKNGFIVDLLNASVSEINWMEIANSVLDSAIQADATADDKYESRED